MQRTRTDQRPLWGNGRSSFGGSWRHRSLIATLAVAACVIAGCGGDNTVDSGASTSQSSSASSDSSSKTTSGESTDEADKSTVSGSAENGSGSNGSGDSEPPELQGATTAAKEGAPASAEMEAAELLRVRIGAHPGYERVVFEFNGETPGYAVSYLDQPPSEDGSGDPVEVDGDKVLAVRMFPASGVRLGIDDFEQIYTGPKRLSGSGEPISDVVLGGDFESQLTWYIGVDGEKPFVVSTLSSPPRVIVDIAN